MSVKELTLDNFDNEVINSGKTVLVDFNADWCGPCQMLKPIIHELADERDDIVIGSVNVDDEPELAERFDVVSIPCLVLFKGGSEADRHTGFLPKDALNTFAGGK